MPAATIKTATYAREITPDRSVPVRTGDHGPTTRTPDIKKLFKEQAGRCCGCAIKGCSQGPVVSTKADSPGCPLNTRVPDFLRAVNHPDVAKALDSILTDDESAKLTEQGLDEVILQLLQTDARPHLRRAFDLAMDRNKLAEILGTVCPQAEELCEGGTSREGADSTCVAGTAGFGAIAIGNNENLIGRIGRLAGWFDEMLDTPLIEDAAGKHKHIFVVGGGPGGMASAMSLRELGYEVTLAFREPHLGGLLTYGLPGTKLDKSVMLAYEKILSGNSGITLMPNTNVDAAMMAEMRDRSCATILAIGAQTQRPLKIEGDHIKGGVTTSLDFLGASITEHNLGEGAAGELSARGKEVVVIGGGDTAMDCVREAVRQKAKKVTLLYRGTPEQMRAVKKEVKRAYEEGVVFDFQQNPLRIEANEFQHVQRVICATGTGENVIEIPHPAQLVVVATGFTGEPDLARKLGLHGARQDPGSHAVHVYKPARSMRITLRTPGDDEETTPSSDVYAIGDVIHINPNVAGSCLAVYAVRDAGIAVRQIDQQCNPAPRL